MPEGKENWRSVTRLLESEAARLRQKRPDVEALLGMVEELIEDLSEIRDQLMRQK